MATETPPTRPDRPGAPAARPRPRPPRTRTVGRPAAVGCAPGWPGSPHQARHRPAGARAAGAHRPGRPPQGRPARRCTGRTRSPRPRTQGQRRRSGDPYITHPLAVTTILAELGMDITTLVAALLHDTVEDTATPWTRSATEFGDDVAHLVDGVTKLDKVKYGESAEAETIRKMVVAMARDPRVLVIKLADRLHNMRTLRFLPPEKQERKARETLEIYAPLAHRLGMNTIKWELEDLAFATLYPKRYDEIVRLVADRAPSRDTQLDPGHRAGPGRAQGRQGAGHGHRPAQALLLDLPEDDRARPRLRRHLRPGRHPGAGRLRPRLLRGAGHDPRAVVTRSRAGSRTTSRCPSSTCTSRCTPR